MPELPFEEVASDLFEFEGRQYIILVDYYSKFIEAEELKDLRSRTTIEALKAQFSRYGIPATLRTDNGPQYCSEKFKDFCKSYGISHKTSSPHTPHSNGEADRTVQTVKKLWCKAPDKHLALLDYRITPLESVGLSPAQLLMGRRPRNKLPTARVLLAPTAYDPLKVKRLLDKSKDTQKCYHDRKRAGNPRPALRPGDEVRMQPYPGNQQWSPGVIVRPCSAPRSYIVETESTTATVSTFGRAQPWPTAQATGCRTSFGLSNLTHQLRRSRIIQSPLKDLTYHRMTRGAPSRPSQLRSTLPGGAELLSLQID